MELRVQRVYPEMSELKAKAAKAKKAIIIEALAISVNSSFPQFDCQSSTLVAAQDDADTKRYARTCPADFTTKIILIINKSTKCKKLSDFVEIIHNKNFQFL